MRLLITGNTGHIGRELVTQAQKEGYEIRTFDRTAGKPSQDWEHHVGDLRDIRDVRRAVQGVDAVAHLGALAHDGAGTPEDVLTVNVQGTWNVLLACVEAGVERGVYFSSVNALGSFGGRHLAEWFPVNDALPHHPLTPYQLSKHLGEEACRSFSERYGMKTVCLRPAFVTRPEFYSRWRERPGEDRTDWSRTDYWAYVDIRDVCDAVLKGLKAENVTHDAFLLTADDTNQDIPTTELVDRFYPEIPWTTISREEYLVGQPHRSLVDCSHAKAVLGWQPRH